MNKEREEYEEIFKIRESYGLKNNPIKLWNEKDYKSYDESIEKSGVIVIYGLNPAFDGHLIKIASQKSKKLIFVWYSEEDKIKAEKIIDNSKDKLVFYKDFLEQYESIDLLNDNFKHTKQLFN